MVTGDSGQSQPENRQTFPVHPPLSRIPCNNYANLQVHSRLAVPIGAGVLPGQLETNTFGGRVPIDWKFFRGAVDKSTLSLIPCEKSVYFRLFEKWTCPRAYRTRRSSRLSRAFPAGELAWLDAGPYARKKKSMQNDTWLTDTSHPDRCPLCSQSLPDGAASCPACGFAVSVPARASASTTDVPTVKRANRSTPIPARASAQHIQPSSSTGASSRHATHSLPGNTAHSSVAHAPETGWQYESPNYEAASSLSTLSLIIAELPTVPPRTTERLSGQINQPQQIDEIDTVPQPHLASETNDAHEEAGTFQQTHAHAYPLPTLFPSFDEIDTLPDPGALSTKEIVPLAASEARETVVDATSWRVEPGSTRTHNSRQATSRSRRRARLTLLDRARWWLVRPGHIELVLRLLGGILLFVLTFLLASVIVLNLPGPIRGFFPTSTPSTSAGISSASSPTVSPPTPTLSVPTATAQASVTPTASPTSAVTVTPAATAPTVQQNALASPARTTPAPSLFMQLAHLNPLIWAIGLCYVLSFLLLGAAARLRRRR